MSMKRHFKQLTLSFCSLFLVACSSSSTTTTSQTGELRDSTPVLLTPSADNTETYSSDVVTIDVSNKNQGYFMVDYFGSNEKVRMQVTGPDSITYNYLIVDRNQYQTFTLQSGDGDYQIQIFENIEGTSYAVAFTQSISVTLENEFSPFLYPNQYVDYTASSQISTLSQQLGSDCYSDLDVVNNVYTYVTENITYDTDKAENIETDYIPDIDDTLTSKTGICFDYASVMTALLRTQSIPTKLEVGYSGEAYHAWISTYIEGMGWIANIIEFDGEAWQLLDPTLGANNTSSAVSKYIGDGSNYVTKYEY